MATVHVGSRLALTNSTTKLLCFSNITLQRALENDLQLTMISIYGMR